MCFLGFVFDSVVVLGVVLSCFCVVFNVVYAWFNYGFIMHE